jgi:hypothetical protein
MVMVSYLRSKLIIGFELLLLKVFVFGAILFKTFQKTFVFFLIFQCEFGYGIAMIMFLYL